jgi:hypothetical protein
MKTYLQHCKGVCREAGIANGEDAINSVNGQIGQLQRISANVRQVWIEIQNMHQHTGLEWRFMRSEFTLTTVAEQAAYSYDDAAIEDTFDTPIAIDRWRNWFIKDYDEPPRVYLTSGGVGGEGWLTYLDWKDFKYIYGIGTQNSSYPAHITINPQNQIVLGPTPSDIYTISGDYMKSAQILVNDADLPAGIPESFEDLIMWKALTRHGIQKNASELITLGEDSAATLLGQLEGDQLGELPVGNPLA